MSQQFIFVPLLVQVGLTCWAYLRLSALKKRASASGEVDEGRRGMHDDAWPAYVQQVNNNIRNQFEVPVLFYVLVISLYVLQAAGLIAQILAWLFAISRIVHFRIHTGSNIVARRRQVFMFGCVMVLALALLLFMKVLF